MGQQSPQGNWPGVHGDAGYILAQWWNKPWSTDPFVTDVAYGPRLMDYSVYANASSPNPLLQQNWTSTGTSTDARDLQQRDGSERGLGIWAASGITADLVMRYPFRGNVSMYTARGNTASRQNNYISVIGKGTGGGSEFLTFDYSNGWWTTFAVDAKIGDTIRVQAIEQGATTPGALISAIMLDSLPMTRTWPVMHDWHFILCDVLGNVIGEVTNADERTLSTGVSKNATAGFKIPTSHYLANLFDDPNKDMLLKVYRDGALEFVGPIVTSDDRGSSSGENTIAVTAASAFWRLGYRLLGTPDRTTNASGWSLGYNLDLGLIAYEILAQTDAPGFSNGVHWGFFAPTSIASAGPYWMKPADQAIQELSNASNSFEWLLRPMEPDYQPGTGVYLGHLDVYDRLGTTPTNAIFEFGAGRSNLVGYGHTLDRTNLCTKGWIQQPGVSDHSGTLYSQDNAAEALRWRYEALIDDGGVEWDVLRQQLVNEAVILRKQARRMLVVTPVANCVPVPNVDFFLGDLIRARIAKNKQTTIDALLRVWGLDFAIDKQGNETATLALAP